MIDNTVSVQDAVEAVARAADRLLRRHSPFHLMRCGGCRAPGFQQPCTLCGFYPHGSDKGTWHPKVATETHFVKMVERSGPAGRDGTIATWHAREITERMPHLQENAVRAAAEIAVPSASLVWKRVVENRGFFRDIQPWHTLSGWRGLEEASIIVHGDRGAGAPCLAEPMNRILDAWITAVHEDNGLSMAAALEEGLALCGDIEFQVGRSGSLEYARKMMGEALEKLRPVATAPQPMR